MARGCFKATRLAQHGAAVVDPCMLGALCCSEVPQQQSLVASSGRPSQSLTAPGPWQQQHRSPARRWVQIVCMQGVFSFSMLSQHGQHHSMQTRTVSTWHIVLTCPTPPLLLFPKSPCSCSLQQHSIVACWLVPCMSGILAAPSPPCHSCTQHTYTHPAGPIQHRGHRGSSNAHMAHALHLSVLAAPHSPCLVPSPPPPAGAHHHRGLLPLPCGVCQQCLGGDVWLDSRGGAGPAWPVLPAGARD